MRSSELAGGLVAAGVRPGDRVGILMRNRIEFIESLYAHTSRSARPSSPHGTSASRRAEMLYPVVDAGLKVVITEHRL